MVTISITPIYMALTALIMAVLAVRAALARGKYRVAIGDGGIDQMSVVVRGFGNLIEYAPAIILLLFFMEHQLTYSAKTRTMYWIQEQLR